jgi:two-component system OmpR family response regulator
MHVPQILVVDDDLEIRKLLARYMKEQGFRVQLASRCAEVRERVATNQIDLIVLDVMLPDGSGLFVAICGRSGRMSRSFCLLR